MVIISKPHYFFKYIAARDFRFNIFDRQDCFQPLGAAATPKKVVDIKSQPIISREFGIQYFLLKHFINHRKSRIQKQNDINYFLFLLK